MVDLAACRGVSQPGQEECGSAAATAPEPDICGDASLGNAEHLIEPSDGLNHGDDSDRKLLRQIGCADRDAFRQLYLHYHGRLARFLSRVTRDHGDVEEIINDVLLIVWQCAGDFRGASRVSTWIFGIAYRCALKSVRRSTARSRLSELAFEDSEAAVEDAARGTEDRQLLDLGLSYLPPEQRMVLVLAYCMDCSCEEIAAIAECPVNTVKSRMFNARRKLRAILSASAVPQAIAARGDGRARPRSRGRYL